MMSDYDEFTRLQDAIYALLRVEIDEHIDGGGCDSGDPVDFTLEEVGQGVTILKQRVEDAKTEAIGWRERALVAEARTAELEAERDRPETEDFFKGVPLEAAHQRARWSNEHDSGKAPADWFWLVGYLAGKCLAAHVAGDSEKALHHTISTAAALANWHMAIKGAGSMRPGIEEPK